ncbi:hypothetical protein [Shewanella sp.]|uniref:hypothetical protein n=1 Tax=Shewanella sp. TaxID=50422 RepID=UPI001A40CFEB|nr:hypothetical protein [Shewanella sp.]MBL4815129.1 hypothetical protein [Shewanella sp.]MCJ8303903.1 hypothetical protein [Shewanella sp.]
MTNESMRITPFNYSKEHADPIESGVKEKSRSKPKTKADIKLRSVRHDIEVRMELRALSCALDLEEGEVISLLSNEDE